MLFFLLLQVQIPFSLPLSPYKRIPGSTRVTFRLSQLIFAQAYSFQLLPKKVFRSSHSSSPGAKIHGAHWSNFAGATSRPGENLLAWSELRASTSAPSCHSGLYSPRASYGRVLLCLFNSFLRQSSNLYLSSYFSS